MSDKSKKIKMSMGEALASGKPVVFKDHDMILGVNEINVVCPEGKEREALHLMQDMGILTIIRPDRRPVTHPPPLAIYTQETKGNTLKIKLTEYFQTAFLDDSRTTVMRTMFDQASHLEVDFEKAQYFACEWTRLFEDLLKRRRDKYPRFRTKFINVGTVVLKTAGVVGCFMFIANSEPSDERLQKRGAMEGFCDFFTGALKDNCPYPGPMASKSRRGWMHGYDIAKGEEHE